MFETSDVNPVCLFSQQVFIFAVSFHIILSGSGLLSYCPVMCDAARSITAIMSKSNMMIAAAFCFEMETKTIRPFHAAGGASSPLKNQEGEDKKNEVQQLCHNMYQQAASL